LEALRSAADPLASLMQADTNYEKFGRRNYKVRKVALAIDLGIVFRKNYHDFTTVLHFGAVEGQMQFC
jgi:hypothetical protein